MKTLSIAGLLAGLAVAAPHANAQPAQLRGSDTLGDVVIEAIRQAGLDNVLVYRGGGSGAGEAGLVNGTQGIAPMSRALNTAAINSLLNQGVTPVQHVIGLDGVSLFVKSTNTGLTGLDIPTIKSIFTCDITDWANVPNSGKTGPIAVYRRNDLSGTTDTFKTLVGVTAFGPCVTIVETTADIADHTSTEDNAIGYAGLSGEVFGGNKPVPVAATATSTPVAPTQVTIRDFSYPLARRLYVNSVADGRFPSDDEQNLLDAMSDHSFMDSILAQGGFVTCLDDADGGCP
jgi:phosphate transport system substrate-binding protein